MLSCSIDKYCYISLRKLPPFFSHKHRIVYTETELVEKISEIRHPAVRACLNFTNVTDGLEIHYDGDLPSRSGLGSSSSFTVGLLLALKAYQGIAISPQKLADTAIHLERNIMQEMGGLQDQVAVSFGGLNFVEFESDEYRVKPVIIPPKNRKDLENSLCLFFTGKSRYAEEIERKKAENLKDKKAYYHCLYELAHKGLECLQAPTFSARRFGELLNESWKMKKELAREVTNPEIEEIYEKALYNGALGGKLLGAGGGGFFLFCVESFQRENFIKSMSHLLHVPFQIEHAGARLVLFQ